MTRPRATTAPRPRVAERAADRAGRFGGFDRGERVVLGEDLLVQGAQRGGRLEAELVVEDVAGAGVHLERVRLPSRLVQGRHQQPGERLLGRVGADDRVEVGDDVGGPAQRQQQLRTLGQGREPQLGESGGLDRRPRLVGEVRERLPAPAAQRRAVQPGGLDVGGIVLPVTAGAGSTHS